MLASWNQYDGITGYRGIEVSMALPGIRRYAGQVSDSQALDLISPARGNLARITATSGLRHVSFQVAATVRRQQLWALAVEPQAGDTLGQLLQGALAAAEARGSTQGLTIAITLQGLLPHPPAPHPKRKPLGGKR